MYDTLQPDLITATIRERQLMKHDPSYVVSWDIFQYNQFPYLEVRKPFILGTNDKQWKATLTHRFFELLYTKTITKSIYSRNNNNNNSKLKRIYTQNIDGLDYQCIKIPRDKIVSVHGSLAEIQCEGCKSDINLNDFCNQVKTNIKDIYHNVHDAVSPTTISGSGSDNDNRETKNKPQNEQEIEQTTVHDDIVVKESKPILCPNCNQPLVKPKTVLFGRNLPKRFFQCIENDLDQVDLLIIAGTSLVVSPANSIVYQVPESTIRVIVNYEPVGKELGIQYNHTTDANQLCGRDLFLKGSCDEIFLELIEQLQWLSDIQEIASELPNDSAKLLSTKAYTSWF